MMLRSASKLLKLNVFFILVLVLASSCKHTSPLEGQYYFQALGKEANIVATADVKKLNEAYPNAVSTGVSYIDDNAERVSVALYKDEYNETDTYPVPAEELKFYGGIEGKFSKTLGNSGLSLSKEFSKVKEGKIKYYTNAEQTLNLAFPESDLLLFASDSYVKAYDESYKNRQLYINDVDAERMGSAIVSCYVREPKTMIDLGFDLPLATLLQMNKALVSVNEENGQYYLNGQLELKDEKLAKTMMTILRNMEIQKAKRNGERPNYALISTYYVQEGEFIELAPQLLDSNKFKEVVNKISNIAGGLI